MNHTQGNTRTRTGLMALAFAACLLAAGPVRAQEDGAGTIEERLARLEAIIKEQAMVIEALKEQVAETRQSKVGYDKGFVIKQDKFKMVTTGRIQLRHTLESPDGKEDVSKFEVRRARLKFNGHAWDPRLEYEMQLSFDRQSFGVEDMWVQWVQGEAFKIRGGLFKAPFGRERLTSSGSQEFVDRSFVEGKFVPGQDIGVMVHGTGLDKHFEYSVGVFNGWGKGSGATNDDTDHLFAARVAWNPFGAVKYEEGAMDHKDALNLGIGLNFLTDDSDNAKRRQAWGLDFAAKYLGWSAQGEYFDGETGLTEKEHDGWYLQTGLFLIPRKFEVAARYGSYDPNGDIDGDDQHEWQLALNYYWNGHKNKLQADYSQFSDDLKDTTDDVFRLQYQIAF